MKTYFSSSCRWAATLLLGSAILCKAVSTLSPGDLAVIGFNADDPEDFSFMTLVDIDGSTSITIQENDGDAASYTTPAGGLAKGSVVVISSPSTNESASVGTIISTINWGWSSNGDGLEFSQNGSYIASADTEAGYVVKPGLSLAEYTAVSHTDAIDTGYYNGPRSGTRSNLLAAIATAANWVYIDTGTINDFIDLDTPPRNTAFTVEDDPLPPPPGTGGLGESSSEVFEGWRFPLVRGVLIGSSLNNVLSFIRSDNSDALSLQCYASNTGGPTEKGWFSVYFTNDIPASSSISSVKLHIHHQGEAAQSGTFKVHISDDRSSTQWYSGALTPSALQSTDIAWDSTEQQTVIDMVNYLDTIAKITNSEFLVANDLSSSDKVYFDYMKLVVEFETFGAPTLNNDAPSLITSTSARLNGTLTAASPEPSVSFFWGDNDGGTNSLSWDNQTNLGTRALGSFSADLDGLLPNSTFFYRAQASNLYATVWAPASTSLTTIAPEVQFASTTSSVPENAGQAVVEVVLSGVAAQPVTVAVSASGGSAINGSDYVYVDGNVTIPAGSISTTATFSVTHDALDEFDETIVFTLSTPTGATIGAPSSHTLTLLDDDDIPSLDFLISPSNTLESASTGTIALVLSAPSGKPVSVNYTTEDAGAEAGLDYEARSGQLQWAPGSATTQWISVVILPDETPEPNESIRIQLSSVTNATIGGSAPGVIVIVDDDTGAPILNNDIGATLISSNSATLGGELLSYGGSPTTVWIYWGATNGQDSAENWATNASLGVLPNGPFSLPVTGLQSTSPYFYRSVASNQYGTVWASNSATFASGPPLIGFTEAGSTGLEGQGRVAITLSITSPNVYAHPITLSYAVTGGTATAGSDYTLEGNSVTLNAGESSTNIYLNITNDVLPEADETIDIQVSQIVNARAGAHTSYTYTIDDDDEQPNVHFESAAYTVSESDGGAVISITLSALSAIDVSLNYTTLDGTAKKDVDYLTRSGSLIWPAGTRETKSITVSLIDDDVSTGDRFFQVSLSDIQNATATNGTLVDVTIEEDDISVPEVTNADGATGIRSRIAILNGEVLRGIPTPEVTLYWGTANGNTSTGAWQHAESLGLQGGPFQVEISGLSPNTVYHYRAFVQNSSGSGWAPDSTNFTSTAAVDYYVNDSSQSDDVYCSAIGNDANSGTQPSLPMANLKALLDTKDIEPGDTIWVDTGNYGIPATILFTTNDVGAQGSSVLIRGSHHASGSDFNGGGSSHDGIEVDVSGDAYVRFENLNITGTAHGFFVHGSGVSQCRSVEIVNCDVSDNFSFEGGIYMVQCREVLIEGCTADNNGLAGIFINVCDSINVISNTCAFNYSWGIVGQSVFNPRLMYNECHDQNVYPDDGWGIALSAGDNEVLVGNRCYNNSVHGISIDGQFSELTANDCYDNGEDGINIVGTGLLLRENRVYDNGRYGISTPAGDGLQADHNLIYNNGNYNLHLSAAGVDAQLEYNTLYGGKGLYINRPAAVTNLNNIIWATGSGNYCIEVAATPSAGGSMQGDYNNLHSTASAKVGKWATDICTELTNWVANASQDSHSISADPLFVSVTAPHDFHPQSASGSWHAGLWQNDISTSPSIDAGHPEASFTLESDYNGLRSNQGAYGNTVQATRTDYNGPLYTLSFGVSPAEAGSITVSPEASVFPTNIVVTLSTVLISESHQWDRWAGDLSSTNQTVHFTLTADTFAQAQYVVLFSNTNGVPDSWLIEHGLPVSQEGVDGDEDSDGLSNGQEYHAGTNPTNELSVLEFMLIDSTPSDRIALSVLSVSGKSYRVRATPGLAPANWVAEAASATPEGTLTTTPIAGTGGALVLYVAPAGQARIYRVETAP